MSLLLEMSLKTSDSFDSSLSRSLFFRRVAFAFLIYVSFMVSRNFFFWSRSALGTRRAIFPTLTNLSASSVSVILDEFPFPSFEFEENSAPFDCEYKCCYSLSKYRCSIALNLLFFGPIEIIRWQAYIKNG